VDATVDPPAEGVAPAAAVDVTADEAVGVVTVVAAAIVVGVLAAAAVVAVGWADAVVLVAAAAAVVLVAAGAGVGVASAPQPASSMPSTTSSATSEALLFEILPVIQKSSFR
jgi:hypothetical protein